LDIKTEFEEVKCALQKTPAFNSQIFSQLQEDTNYEVALKMLARFHTTLIESIGFINKGLESENAELVWKACHKVAGTAELIGFVNLGQISRELSKNIKASNDLSLMPEITKYIDETLLLKNEIEKAFIRMNDYL